MNAQNICRYKSFMVYYHKIETKYKKPKFVISYAHKHRSYMAPFVVEGNVNKCKHEVFNHNCIKFTVVSAVLL